VFILASRETEQVYYTSSLSPKTEIKQIKPLITQILGAEAAKSIQIIHGDKQKNT